MQKINFKQMIVIFVGIFLLAGNAVSQNKMVVEAVPIDGPIQENLSESARLFESIEADILNKLHKTSVTVFIPKPQTNSSTRDYKISLNLGIAVAGALASVVNHEKDVFLNYAGIVFDYGERLGVEETILSKYNTMVKTASENNWEEVEKLIYDLKDDITTELHNDDLKGDAILAMVSGWLEGLYIVAKSLESDVSEDANKLLRNRDFVRYLTENMNSLDADLKNKNEVNAVFAALPEIDKVINKPVSYTYTKHDVKTVLKITEPLRKIMTVDKAK